MQGLGGVISVPGYLSHGRNTKQRGEAGDVWRAMLMCRCSCRVIRQFGERRWLMETVGSRQFVGEVELGEW